MLKKHIEELMKRVNTRNLSNLERDIQIVLTYFGLGTQPYPTYESVADELGVSRQRVQQIVSKRFINKIKDGDLEVVRTISQLIEQSDVSFVDHFNKQIQDKGLVTGQVHIRGLFRLLQKFGYCMDYNLYNIELSPATEMDYVQMEKLLFIKNDKHAEVVERMRTIKTLPGLHGMVNFLDVRAMNSWLQGSDIDFYQTLIIHDKTAKVFLDSKDQYNMWYLFEDRSNVLINALGKVVNITDKVKTDILAETIHSDISKRSLPKRNPTVDIIKHYIRNSKFITIDGDFAKIDVDQRTLTEIEHDIYDYFKSKNKETASFPELNSYLEQKGHEEAYRKQKLYHCPFVYVDKSRGRSNYQLMLINQFSPEQEDKNSYDTYRNKLKELQGKTDVTCEARQRKEQTLLQDWLFLNKKTEECAICGRTFSCRSLVTAHKKKRSICTEEERTDPYIVMPACVFGCDYLYEKGYVKILLGSIHIQKTEQLQKAERDYLQGLEGRDIDPRWLRGSESYFTSKEKDSILI